jgi:hypothetical protein
MRPRLDVGGYRGPITACLSGPALDRLVAIKRRNQHGPASAVRSLPMIAVSRPARVQTWFGRAGDLQGRGVDRRVWYGGCGVTTGYRCLAERVDETSCCDGNEAEHR